MAYENEMMLMYKVHPVVMESISRLQASLKGEP